MQSIFNSALSMVSIMEVFSIVMTNGLSVFFPSPLVCEFYEDRNHIFFSPVVIQKEKCLSHSRGTQSIFVGWVDEHVNGWTNLTIYRVLSCTVIFELENVAVSWYQYYSHFIDQETEA